MSAAFDPHQFDRYFAIVQLVEIGVGSVAGFLVGKVRGAHAPFTAGGFAEKTKRRLNRNELRLAVRQICFAAVKRNYGVLDAGDHQERERMRELARVLEVRGQAGAENGQSRKADFLIAGEAQGQHPACSHADEEDFARVGNSLGDKLRDEIMNKCRIAVRLGARRVGPMAGLRLRVDENRSIRSHHFFEAECPSQPRAFGPAAA